MCFWFLGRVLGSGKRFVPISHGSSKHSLFIVTLSRANGMCM